ncbi:MAG: sigma-70 family RNA polymerase sigma factor [Bacteroidales bacterium]|mgnify:FL=1|jgi:RNA polymerase sigma factor (sigma-70 family)|nr:sigma-70 family RNA polymerase sigma factor [Bacteroidales bacterium]
MKNKLSLDESTIIQGIKNNNTMAITYAYKKYYPSVANYIRLNGGNDDDAKDIFQEAMMVLFHNTQKEHFQLSCQLNTYLYSIARNLWLTELRRQNKNTTEIEDFDQLLSEDELLMEEAEEKVKAQRNLKLSLETLGEPCKTILTAFYIEQLSMQEIAEKMGYTNSENAKNQKYKCLLRLKKIYQKL